jgi:hypothetical protein
VPYIVAENLFVKNTFKCFCAGVSGYPATHLIDSKHYTKFTPDTETFSIKAIDTSATQDANCVIIWSDKDDPNCYISVKKSETTLDDYTGIVRGFNFYTFTLEENVKEFGVYFEPEKTLTLRHAWIGKYHSLRPSEYYDPEHEEVKRNQITNYFGDVIYNDYQANHVKLNVQFNYLNPTEQTAINELKRNCWQNGLAFWYIHSTTNGNLYKLDTNGFMLAYQKGQLRGTSIQATGITRMIEDLPADYPSSRPTSLVFSDVTDTTITLSWTMATCEPDGYLVTRNNVEIKPHSPTYNSTYDVGQSWGSEVVAHVGTNCGFTDTGLTAGTKYYYNIFSYKNKKRSWYYYATPLSGNQTTTGGSSLGTPTLLTPTTNYVTADLTTTFDWTDVVSATSYRIEIASDSGFLTVVETGTPATSTYTSSGLTAGQTYYWRVRAEAGATYGDYTAEFIIKTLGTVTLSTPTNNYVTADLTTTFDWSDATYATGYVIEIATANTFGATIVETGTPAVSTYDSTGLSAGSTYYWRARPTAEGGVEEGTNSSTYTIKTLGTVTLDTPADASFTSDTTPTFVWNAATNATGYIAELATDDGFVTIIETYTGANTTFTATTVATDCWLYWRVRPTAEAGAEVGNNTDKRSLELFAFRGCLDFDGANDYATIPDANVFRLNEGAGGKAMSWSIWLNPDTLGNARWGFFQKGDMAGTEREYQLYYQTISASYRIGFSIFGAADGTISIGRFCTNGDLVTGAAQHVVATYDGASTIKIYINSVQKDVSNSNAGSWSAPYSADGLLRLGQAYFSSGSRYLDGKQDEFAIYSKALSQAEIDSLYNGGSGRSANLVASANLVGYWKNNEGSGTNVNDETANNNDTTLAASPGTPSWTTW